MRYTNLAARPGQAQKDELYLAAQPMRAGSGHGATKHIATMQRTVYQVVAALRCTIKQASQLTISDNSVS